MIRCGGSWFNQKVPDFRLVAKFIARVGAGAFERVAGMRAEWLSWQESV